MTLSYDGENPAESADFHNCSSKCGAHLGWIRHENKMGEVLQDHEKDTIYDDQASRSGFSLSDEMRYIIYKAISPR